MYYTSIKNNIIEGFYIEDIHGVNQCDKVLSEGGIIIDEELHHHLISLGRVEFKGSVESKIYRIEDKLLFEKVIPKVDVTQKPLSIEERISALEEIMMGVI